MNLTDRFLNAVILRFLTKDEWHTAVLGFCDGLSFEMEGRWMRRALAKTSIDVANISVEKPWYYRAPYVAGELLKFLFIVQVINPW